MDIFFPFIWERKKKEEEFQPIPLHIEEYLPTEEEIEALKKKKEEAEKSVVVEIQL